MLWENVIFVFLYNFYSCMLNRFANKHLKNRFNLILVIKKIWISFKNLSVLVLSLWIGHEYSWRWSINFIIWLNLLFINPIFSVTQLFPVVSPGHLLHLHILVSLLFPLSLPLPLLCKSPWSHLILSLFHICFFHPLLFNQGWVRLHVHRNNQSSKSITSNNTPIIHYILWSHLSV